MREHLNLRKMLADDIAAAADMPPAEISSMLETPPDPKMGDMALPCFRLAKKLRKAPPKIAEELAKKLGKPSYLERLQVVGGYLNVYFRPRMLIESILIPASEAGCDWGRSDQGAGKTIVIDYSSINIAKPLHIGHLSSTAIGAALYRIYRYLGYTVVGVNHLGDWGTQFGKMIAAYKHWGNPEDVERDGVHELVRLYVKFHTEAEKDESLNDEGRAWFRKIEDGDPEATEIFGWFKELTLRQAKAMYDRLGVQFDSYAGESFYNDMLPGVIQELRDKNLLEESEGAQIVRLDEEELPPAVVLKSDGTTLYLTRDIACAEYRKKTYDFHKNLYVVAYQQNLHFKQLFALLRKMGYDWADQNVHIPFGMVSLGKEAIATRQGNVILLKEVLAKAIEKTKAVISEKNPDLENKDEVAEMVGQGAVIYATLAQSRIKDTDFSFDKVLNFDGETGPYVQYTHARCVSVLSKASKEEREADPDYGALDNAAAVAVVKKIGDFPEALEAAVDKDEPFYVTRSITSLAQEFNKYYFDNKIIRPDDLQGTAARLTLTRVVRDVLWRGLELLGIKAPDRM